MHRSLNRFCPAVLLLVSLAVACGLGRAAWGDDGPGDAAPPTTQPAGGADDNQPPKIVNGIGHFPHLEFDVKKKQVRVECEALGVDAPLEFFCCLNGTNEHESVLRSPVRPRDVHVALLAVGLVPGAPITFDPKTQQWLPPHGPRLRITVEYQKGDKTISAPAQSWLRDQHNNKVPDDFKWVFCGSRIMPNGRYAADDTGYIVSIVNFDYTLIDVPSLVSSSDETLEWVRNKDLTPPKGTKVWMVIEPYDKPGDKPADAAATKPAE